MTNKVFNQDSLQRFIFENAPVRGESIHLHNTFQTIVNQHDYPKPLRQLLGEALCVAGLLTAIIKFNGRLTVQFRGKGKLKLLLAQCNHLFQMRSLAKWEGEMSYADLMESFNQGVLAIMLDSGPSNRYQGIVSWRGNSLAESVEGYFRDSEQLATKIWLAVNKISAAGFLLQAIPSVERDLARLEDEVVVPHWEHITKLTMKMKPEELLMMDNPTLLTSLYPEEEVRIFHATPVTFKCTCSKKRSEDAILVLGKDEADAELKDKHVIDVTCDFCNKTYVYDRVDVANIFKKNDKPNPQTTH